MKSIYLRIAFIALLAICSLAARGADFSEENADGIGIQYTILTTEEGATPEVEVADLVLSSIDKIQKLVIPSTVTHGEVTYNVTAIGENAIYGRYNIESIEISEGLKTIKPWGICCPKVKFISLPKTLETIENRAFSGTSIGQILIPENVSSIGYGAFLGCQELSTIEVSEKNASFASYRGMLYDKELTELVVCPAMHNDKLYFPPTVARVGNYSFYENKNLKTIDFPRVSDLTIGVQAFFGSNIVSLNLSGPEKLSIEHDAFWRCSNLKEVFIDAGVTKIGSCVFNDCLSLDKLTVSDANPKYSSDGIALFNKDKTELISILDSYTGDYHIPATVKTLYNFGSELGQRLHKLYIPESVETISAGNTLREQHSHIVIENPDVNSITLNGDALKEAKTICVPSESLDAYKSAWYQYADKITDGSYEMTIDLNEPLSTKKTVNVPVSLKNADPFIAFQCDIHLPDGVSIDTDANNNFAFTLSDRAAKSHFITSGVVTDGSTVSGLNTVIRVVCVSLSNAKFKGNDGVLFNIPVKLNRIPDQYWSKIAIDNIHLSKPGNIREDLPCETRYFRAIDYIPGDADDDGDVSVVDVTASLSYMIGKDVENFVAAAVDFDKDGALLITDITALIDLTLGGLDEDEPAAAIVRAEGEEGGDTESAYTFIVADVTAEEGSQAELHFFMTNTELIKGFQCDITLPEGVTINKVDDEYDFHLNPERAVDHISPSREHPNNKVRILSVSLTDQLLKGHSGELFWCPITVNAPVGEYDITLSRIILSADGNKRVDVPNYIGKLTVTEDSSAIIEIESEQNGDDVRYFDLQGRPATESTHGIVISTTGEKVIR